MKESPFGQAEIKVKCQACGGEFKFSQMLPRERKIRSLPGGGIEVHPCPNCGYIQTWMFDACKRKRVWRLGPAGALAGSMLLFVANGLDTSICMWIVFAMTGFCVGVVVNMVAKIKPNKKYQGLAPKTSIPHYKINFLD